MRLDYIALERLYYNHEKEKQYWVSSCRELIFPNIITPIPVFIKPYTDKLKEDFGMMRYSMQNDFVDISHAHKLFSKFNVIPNSLFITTINNVDRHLFSIISVYAELPIRLINFKHFKPYFKFRNAILPVGTTVNIKTGLYSQNLKNYMAFSPMAINVFAFSYVVTIVKALITLYNRDREYFEKIYKETFSDALLSQFRLRKNEMKRVYNKFAKLMSEKFEENNNSFYVGTHQKAWVFTPRYTQFINYLSDYGVAHFLKNFVFDFSKKKISKSYVSQLLLKSKILPSDSNDYNGLYSFMVEKVNLKALYKFLDDKYAH